MTTTYGRSGTASGLRLIRRLILFWSLLFWQGGFMFYGGVVIPIGSRILGSDLEQGQITQSVTNSLNVAGVAALAAWGWDIFSERGTSFRDRRLRQVSWCLLVLALGLLAWLHLRMDALIDADVPLVLDRRRFRTLHRWYLLVSTAQWVGSLLLSALTIRAWRDGDAARGGLVPPPKSPGHRVDGGDL